MVLKVKFGWKVAICGKIAIAIIRINADAKSSVCRKIFLKVEIMMYSALNIDNGMLRFIAVNS